MRRFKTFAISLIVLASVVSLHRVGYLRPAEDLVLKVVSPIGKFLNISTNSGKGIFGGISGLKDLQKENKDLQNKLNRAEQEIVGLQEAKTENESLRKDLEFKLTEKYETLSASVIMYDPASIRQTVIIDKGENDGVKEGQAVVSEGFLVGKITEVDKERAKVFLITDPVSAIPVYVQNSTATGILRGQIGHGLSIEKIPQGDVLKQGQFVVTSGLGGDYIKGLIIGKLDEINKSDNAIFQESSVRPEVNFGRLERVLIIK